LKTTWAIICSFVLAGTPFLLAQTPSSCVKQVRACCQHGGEMACCKESSSPDSQSKPAVPSQTGNQGQLSLLAPNVLVWTPPTNLSVTISSRSTPSSMTASAPLYARDCARLI
jgi:hypothetical protein